MHVSVHRKQMTAVNMNIDMRYYASAHTFRKCPSHHTTNIAVVWVRIIMMASSGRIIHYIHVRTRAILTYSITLLMYCMADCEQKRGVVVFDIVYILYVRYTCMSSCKPFSPSSTSTQNERQQQLASTSCSSCHGGIAGYNNDTLSLVYYVYACGVQSWSSEETRVTHESEDHL